MDKIVTIEQAKNIADTLRKQEKKIVLAGGCFDILHIGHIHFLKESKKQGDVLFVLLESDSNITRYKGQGRPINAQESRAEVLSELQSVDYVVLLPEMRSNKDYDDVIMSLKPAIITTTIGDPNRSHKERQAALVRANVVDVVDRIANASTSHLAKLLAKEL